MGGKSKSSKKSVSSSKDAAAASSSKQGRINAALASLAKNILPPNEEPGLKSLIAGLLSSYRQPKSTQLTNFTSNVSLNVLSPYTINLHSLAERVIEMHNENPNRAQLALLNLLFRSVGGTKDSDLPMGGGGVTDVEEDEEEEEEETILEDMQSDDWAAVVTDLVDEMRHVPANQILLCADPLGAVHQEHAMKNHGDNSYDDDDVDEKKKGTKQYVLGAAEFRKIYKEFWYILGYVALTEGGMATNTQQDDDDDESPGNVVRLDAGLVKELIVRVIELAPVGQPDVRAGAILAAISMSHAVLDQSAQLVKKMDVASRQYQAAKKGKNSSKAEALKVRIDSLKRSAQDLEEVVLGNVIQGLFVHRYR
jgi:cohesin complex subunit SA-1/2